jgi:hypothetical protein
MCHPLCDNQLGDAIHAMQKTLQAALLMKFALKAVKDSKGGKHRDAWLNLALATG